MITFTKEQLIASAHARIEFAEMMLAGELEPLKERTWSIELELARIALASLEAEAAAGDYQPAIDILRDKAARELDGGFRSHHNALIYAANELQNAQAFGREVSHES